MAGSTESRRYTRLPTTRARSSAAAATTRTIACASPPDAPPGRESPPWPSPRSPGRSPRCRPGADPVPAASPGRVGASASAPATVPARGGRPAPRHPRPRCVRVDGRGRRRRDRRFGGDAGGRHARPGAAGRWCPARRRCRRRARRPRRRARLRRQRLLGTERPALRRPVRPRQHPARRHPCRVGLERHAGQPGRRRRGAGHGHRAEPSGPHGQPLDQPDRHQRVRLRHPRLERDREHLQPGRRLRSRLRTSPASSGRPGTTTSASRVWRSASRSCR